MAEAPHHATRKPLFTKRHYEALAGAFAEALAGMSPGGVLSDERQGALWALAEVADVLEGDNPRFDRERFLEASGCQKKGTEQ